MLRVAATISAWCPRERQGHHHHKLNRKRGAHLDTVRVAGKQAEQPATAGTRRVAESFFSTLELDLLYWHSWPTRVAARSASFEDIEGLYNRERRSSTLGNLSPAD
jgi:hypothetical protein